MSGTIPHGGPAIRRAEIRHLRRVARYALLLYEIEPVSLSLLAHVFNTTFTVIDAAGARYVLHITRSDEGAASETQRRAWAEWELWWLDRVHNDLDLAVPIAVRTPEGEGAVSVPTEGYSAPELCTLVRWIDGRFLDRGLRPSHLQGVGRLTARLHHHSTSLTVPAGFDRPTVDRADEETEEDVVRLFRDHQSVEAAGVMQAAFGWVRQTQNELGPAPQAFGLIHADIHQKNYLFHHGEVRLIDFGDCGWGHYLYDLAVTLSQLEDHRRYWELRDALLTGYRQVRDLSPAEEASIDAFIMLRDVQDLAYVLRERDNPSYRRWAEQIGTRVARLDGLLAARA